ncbi:hypothetical protein TraAM80_06360 [Trypanosoma rangeli]|uniref:Uncharacterized protein n=1 Tax=Trypanosoma rangeli TaxID=5698 RepID=A0A422NAF0_TRYRA|nr:uncharacterized protein TraAM80_06360 [Trypanosoma rangeli]RNF02454.1 hypothetical protein TraAM80_06360 [Trypanosoma rangeli]|eukprot:RNF02454.1 hypothetical protein TraAM80_06360 [Trypanosoma rangeli]
MRCWSPSTSTWRRTRNAPRREKLSTPRCNTLPFNWSSAKMAETGNAAEVGGPSHPRDGNHVAAHAACQGYCGAQETAPAVCPAQAGAFCAADVGHAAGATAFQHRNVGEPSADARGRRH